MMSKKDLAVATVVFMLTGSCDAAITKLANKAEFDALCEIAALADLEAEAAEELTGGEAAYEAIRDLNMTLSPEEWTKMFKKENGTGAWETTVPEPMKNDPVWQQMWPTWLKAAQSVANTNKKETLMASAGLKDAPENARQLVYIKLQPIAEAAEHLHAQLKQQTAGEKFTEAKKSKQELNQIVYGHKTKPSAAPQADAIFKSTTGNTHSAHCEGAGATHAATTVVGTIICLCAKGASSGLDHACIEGNAATTQWNGNHNSAPAQWTEISKFCGPTAEKKITAKLLRTKLTAVQNKLRIHSGDGYLGSFLQTSCDGNSGNGVCVKFTGYSPTGQQHFKEVPWVKKKSDFADKLEEAEKAREKAAALTEQLSAAKRQVERLKTEAKGYAEYSKISIPKAKTPTKVQQEDNNKECDQHKDNKKACAADTKCMWKGGESGDKGECKPKVGEEGVKAENDGKTTTPQETIRLSFIRPLFCLHFCFYN
uniref:Variant surface glycoprotein 1125.4082 n=1 Tax=Trypanosoma brucei TaxID=5691 RepID=A0A1J0R9Y5_9TRYP|nr:variant surface glycoprotein 1125.4082 [Trypanosoma brucei]